MDINKVIQRAGEIQSKANDQLSQADKKEQIKYSDMIEHPEDKIYLMRLMDESTQITNKAKLVKRIKFLHKQYGVLKFLTPWEKTLFQMFVSFGELAPGLSVPAFQSYLRSTTAKVIINEAPRKLHSHLSKRDKDKIGQNVNLIGEVVLGEGEALKRYHHYLESLEDPQITYMSIKISGIFSQLHPLNHDQSKIILKERLTELYRKAIAYPAKDIDGNISPKFINMDMEEYKDVELTYDVFTETLDQEEFKDLYAGLVVQAYLPDAVALQKKLVAWATKRVANGGAPIKMRLVKGANLQMEEVESSMKHWPCPIHSSKTETDASYLKIIDYGFKPENIEVVHMGIASHNLFSIAYAQQLAEQNNIQKHVSFEMLEGMANNLVRAMHSFGFNIVLYTPVVTNENFLNAVSYLVRRLDENTGTENFIAHSFNLTVDNDSWKFLLNQFNEALALKDKLTDAPKRQQDRINETYTPSDVKAAFKSEPDTNFDLPNNFKWSKAIVEKWKFNADSTAIEFPVYVGKDLQQDCHFGSHYDNNQEPKVEVSKTGRATQEQVEAIIEIAQKDPSKWRDMTADERLSIFVEVANTLRQHRGDLIGIMCATTGKTVMEGDVEVSEGIDFVEYYPRSAKALFAMDNIAAKGKGTVLVVPPWNFPMAIPVGGVIAGLAAGNTVIIKPATASAPIAFYFVQLMHQAGIPKEALQIVLPKDRSSLNYLTKHEAISHIILTGGTETAYRILENNPKVPLSAETGGKNALIVTSSADKDIAIASAAQSAFLNAGQKCSACSLLLLQSDLYDDAEFMAKLKDTTESMYVGNPWDLSSEIGPMIAPTSANKELVQAMNKLEDGESWLVEPKVISKNEHLLSPGVKLGVKPGNFTFKTELFAPVMAVVRFEELDEAINMVNSTGYGLTSGIHSLDEREHAIWLDKIEAGNLYINRSITGAIVQRQPFGGVKESAFGNGIKAGGPNYVSCFMNFEEGKTKSCKTLAKNLQLSPDLYKAIKEHKESKELLATANNYAQAYASIFSQSVDVSNIIGEDNNLRYIPAFGLGLRIRENDDLKHILMIALAVEISKSRIDVSVSTACQHKDLVSTLFADVKTETDEVFYARAHSLKRLRLCGGDVNEEVYDKLTRKGTFLANTVPMQSGRLELLNYLQEQSVTKVYHRYGNLGDRE